LNAVIEIACPAKVNLFLSVGPPDDSGMHPIRTVFQAISLFDTLRIERAPGRTAIEFEDEAVPEDNTLTKTLRLLAEVAELPPLNLTVIKRIPSEAGLGGASSDAAGLLRAIPLLTRSRASEFELSEIARAVGADVPFFLVGGRAKAEGYGERLTPLEDPIPFWLVVAQPEARCSTREAYARLDEIQRSWREFPLADDLHNDFELVAPEESLALKQCLLDLNATEALLCGSGSAVFGIFPDEPSAERARRAVAPEVGGKAWVCRSLTRMESLSL